MSVHWGPFESTYDPEGVRAWTSLEFLLHQPGFIDHYENHDMWPFTIEACSRIWEFLRGYLPEERRYVSLSFEDAGPDDLIDFHALMSLLLKTVGCLGAPLPWRILVTEGNLRLLPVGHLRTVRERLWARLVRWEEVLDSRTEHLPVGPAFFVGPWEREDLAYFFDPSPFFEAACMPRIKRTACGLLAFRPRPRN